MILKDLDRREVSATMISVEKLSPSAEVNKHVDGAEPIEVDSERIKILK